MSCLRDALSTVNRVQPPRRPEPRRSRAGRAREGSPAAGALYLVPFRPPPQHQPAEEWTGWMDSLPVQVSPEQGLLFWWPLCPSLWGQGLAYRKGRRSKSPFSLHPHSSPGGCALGHTSPGVRGGAPGHPAQAVRPRWLFSWKKQQECGPFSAGTGRGGLLPLPCLGDGLLSSMHGARPGSPVPPAQEGRVAGLGPWGSRYPGHRAGVPLVSSVGSSNQGGSRSQMCSPMSFPSLQL